MATDATPTSHQDQRRYLTAGDLASRPVITVTPEQTLRDAARVMVAHTIGAVVVVDSTDAAVGILSERDVLRAFATDASAQDAPVGGHMTVDIISVDATWAVHEAGAAMTDHHIRHVVVTGDDHGLGIISIRDVLLAGQRIDLGGGEWAILRDPMGFTVRERRRLQRQLLQLGPGPADDLDLDGVIAEMVGAWSFAEAPDAQTIASRAPAVHEVLRRAVEQELPNLQRAVHPAPGWRAWAETP